MRCVNAGCATKTWVLSDHRIAAKKCLLTTRAAKWTTVQVGTGRTVSEVTAELDCDWHTVNDAVTTYGEAFPRKTNIRSFPWEASAQWWSDHVGVKLVEHDAAPTETLTPTV
jgi:hypothetical protein